MNKKFQRIFAMVISLLLVVIMVASLFAYAFS